MATYVDFSTLDGTKREVNRRKRLELRHRKRFRGNHVRQFYWDALRYSREVLVLHTDQFSDDRTVDVDGSVVRGGRY